MTEDQLIINDIRCVRGLRDRIADAVADESNPVVVLASLLLVADAVRSESPGADGDALAYVVKYLDGRKAQP